MLGGTRLVHFALAVLSFIKSLLLRCRDVLLNGRTVWERLWSVAVGAAPTLLWTLSFKKAKLIPISWRPPIHIDLLPRWNEILLSPFTLFAFTLALIPLARYLYLQGDALEKTGEARRRPTAFALSVLCFPAALSVLDCLGQTSITPALDIFAFGSYGALHFASPIIAAWWIWGFGVPGAAATFGWCLGIQNLCGLATHLIFPNAAPWFYDVYGADASNPDYSYPGNPAGLVRVDEILGTHIYKHAFGKSPVVFGAIPSLHAATSICVGLFVARYSSGIKGLCFMWLYCSWMFWATMYLHHHFAIDLVLGALYSTVSFFVAERICLQKLDHEAARRGLTNGWERLRWGATDGAAITRSGSVSPFESPTPETRASYAPLPTQDDLELLPEPELGDEKV